jgi:hypothetical protein
MPPLIPKPQFPANVPAKLITEFDACEHNFRALARHLDINPAHVWNLLKLGKEPKNKTLRKKLFLPEKVRHSVPAWVGQAATALGKLETSAPPSNIRVYDRRGKRVRIA